MNVNNRGVQLTDEQPKTTADEQWAERLEEKREGRDNRGDLIRSRYELVVSPEVDVYKYTDITNGDCRYFEMSQHEAIIEWLDENGLGTVLDDYAGYEETWTLRILVRPQCKEADERLFKFRWWDEGIDPLAPRWVLTSTGVIVDLKKQ